MKAMEQHKTFLLTIILFVSFQICFGQENFKPRQIDKFGKITCDDLSARLDALRNELGANEKAIGYIITYANKDNLPEAYQFEENIKGFFPFLGIDEKRVILAHGKSGNALETQLWVISPGSDKPSFEEEKWSYALPKVTKPFILYGSNWGEICSFLHPEEYFSKLLFGNPSFQGNIVIFEKSSKKFLKTKSALTKKLVNKYKVPPKRLKFYYVKSDDYPNFEFWLVPRRKK